MQIVLGSMGLNDHLRLGTSLSQYWQCITHGFEPKLHLTPIANMSPIKLPNFSCHCLQYKMAQ